MEEEEDGRRAAFTAVARDLLHAKFIGEYCLRLYEATGDADSYRL